MTRSRGILLLIMGLVLALAFASYGSPTMQLVLLDFTVLCH
jgi:hypothetical protein